MGSIMVKENEEVQCEQVEDTEYYPLNEQLEDFYDMLIVEDVPVKLNEAKDEMIIENIDYFAEAGKMLNDGDAYNARIMLWTAIFKAVTELYKELNIKIYNISAYVILGLISTLGNSENRKTFNTIQDSLYDPSSCLRTNGLLKLSEVETLIKAINDAPRELVFERVMERKNKNLLIFDERINEDGQKYTIVTF